MMSALKSIGRKQTYVVQEKAANGQVKTTTQWLAPSKKTEADRKALEGKTIQRKFGTSISETYNINGVEVKAADFKQNGKLVDTYVAGDKTISRADFIAAKAQRKINISKDNGTLTYNQHAVEKSINDGSFKVNLNKLHGSNAQLPGLQAALTTSQAKYDSFLDNVVSSYDSEGRKLTGSHKLGEESAEPTFKEVTSKGGQEKLFGESGTEGVYGKIKATKTKIADLERELNEAKRNANASSSTIKSRISALEENIKTQKQLLENSKKEAYSIIIAAQDNDSQVRQLEKLYKEDIERTSQNLTERHQLGVEFSQDVAKAVYGIQHEYDPTNKDEGKSFSEAVKSGRNKYATTHKFDVATEAPPAPKNNKKADTAESEGTDKPKKGKGKEEVEPEVDTRNAWEHTVDFLKHLVIVPEDGNVGSWVWRIALGLPVAGILLSTIGAIWNAITGGGQEAERIQKLRQALTAMQAQGGGRLNAAA